MSKRERTTLYEVMRSRQPGEVPQAGAGGAAPPPPAPASMPTGVIVTAIVVSIVVGAAAYVVGFARGRAAGFEEGRTDSVPPVRVVDPTLHTPPGAASAATLPAQAGGGTPPSAAAADPRHAGLNYYILVEQATPERAGPMVDFLRNEGLDAYARKWDNGRFLQVFVLPGFESGSLKSAEAESVRLRVLQAGRKWKAAAPGNEDFATLYLRKF